MPESWSTFSRKYWEKKPTTFRAPTERADAAGASGAADAIGVIDAAEIFRLLVKYSDRCRKLDSCEGVKFYVDGVRLESFETIDLLPVKNDKSLQGYHQRMNSQFKDYGLVCDELLQVLDSSPRARAALRKFLRGLYEFVGVPNRFAELGLYLGNYRKTPFGVHVDPCGVFSFPVVGQKTFRLWDPAFVEKNPELKEAFSYDEFKKKSYVMQVGPGDISYWPSTHWHIAESDGSFSCTWSIGIWVDRPLSDVITSALAPQIAKSLGPRGKRTTLRSTSPRPTSAEALPEDLALAAKAISNLSEAQIRKLLAKWWRDHYRRDGLK